jgi:hypothetical protein
MGLNLKKVVSVSILVAAIVVVVALGFLFLKSNSLVVPFMQPTQITVNQVQYTLMGDATGLIVYTGIAPTGTNSKTLTRPVAGETYPCLGIDVKILEIHADRYVVSVTPNDAKPDENSDGSIGFMGTASVTITNVAFNTGAPNTICVSLRNTGTKAVTITQIKVNNADATIDSSSTLTCAAGDSGTITLYSNWVAGNPYKIDLFESNGQVVGSYQAVAPS